MVLKRSLSTRSGSDMGGIEVFGLVIAGIAFSVGVTSLIAVIFDV